MRLFASIAIVGVAAIALAAEPHRPAPHDLIAAATTRPWPGESFPALPSLSTNTRQQIEQEMGRAPVRRAFELLDARRSENTNWFGAVEIFEKEKATWSLQACLVHPSEDVQINALRALGRLKDKNAVPFLLIYGDYMAVFEAGSENATIHGIIHESIAGALPSITGVEVKIKGQNPEALKRGLRLWTKWLVEQPPPAAH
jgi:hypothetical protein